jgi:dihydroorotase
MQYAKTFGYTVWLRPQDPYIGIDGVAHSGAYATRMGLAGVPVMAETIALHTIFELQRATGARVHLCRISSAAGAELIRQAKREGLDVSCDVGIHHLHLSDSDIGFFDANARLTPPLRSERDRDALRMAVLDGTIDAICSDHTPVDDDEKLLPFAQASPGATGLELLLSLTLKWANERHINLPIVIAKITSAPAQVARLKAGNLTVGSCADLCIFNASAEWIVEEKTLASQGKHTPFLNYSVPGVVHSTIVAGRVVYSL